jgi:RecQ family ATP-dependent DNA helicase
MGRRRIRYENILKKYFGYDKLKDIQYKIIDNILKKNRDVCAILATGFGKSLCYQLPFLIADECVIVISPLIALMEDQVETLRSLNIPVCCLNSNNKYKNREKGQILKENYKIIYMTPEYLVKSQDFIEELYEDHGICCFAIDECHCISTWSDVSFRPEYKNLKLIREWAPEVPILALTATASNKVQKDIIKSLKLIEPLVIKSSFDRPNLHIHVHRKSKDIYDDISDLVKKYRKEFIIIYAKTRDNTEKISDIINNMNILCKPYHAGMDTEKRNKIQNKFMSGKIKCIVATIAFGMGINNKNVRLIIQYGCSNDIESYYQEIGRAGRDGDLSECHMFFSKRDFQLNRYFLSEIKDKKFYDYREKQIIKMEKFAYSNTCRRKYILEHFGESVDYENCNKCDNCLNTKNIQKEDFTDQAFMIIKLIKKLNINFGCGTIIGILRGSKSKKINPSLRKSSLYGSGSKYNDKWWNEFIRLLLTNEYLQQRSIVGRKFGSVITCTNKALTWYNNIKKNKRKNITSSDSIENNLDENLRLILSTNEILNKNKPIEKKNFDEILEDFGIDSSFLLEDNKSLNREIYVQTKKVENNKSFSTKDMSYKLFMENKMNLDMISKARNMKKQTIENHLVHAINMNKKLDLYRLGFTKKIHKTIKKIIISKEINRNVSKLKPIYDLLPRNISYLHIKLSIEIIKCKSEKNYFKSEVI